MNKKIFLERLERALRRIPTEDREDALNYYREYFEEMEIDETVDVTGQFGQPEEVAKGIISDCAVKHIDNQKDGIKSSATVIWMVILGICASPIAIPFAIAILAVLGAILISLAAIVFSVFVSGIALAISGIGMVIFSFLASGVGQTLLIIGFGLVALGLGVIICVGGIKLCEIFAHLIAKAFRKLLLRKKVA